MTADAKVGLLLGLIFIVMIAFLINGLPNFLQTANAEDAVDVTITVPPAQDLVIDDRVIEIAEELQRNDIPLRQSTPPQEVVLLDSGSASVAGQQQRPQPTVVATPNIPVQTSTPQPRVSTSKTHVVASGENLAVIAQKYYGKEEGNRRVVIQSLFEANKNVLKSADSVRVGQKLSIPPLEALMAGPSQPVAQVQLQRTAVPQQSGPSFMQRVSNLFERSDNESSVKIHIVQDGESLWGIAQETLGDGKRYKEILKLNKAIKDADDVVAGTRLKLPNP